MRLARPKSLRARHRVKIAREGHLLPDLHLIFRLHQDISCGKISDRWIVRISLVTLELTDERFLSAPCTPCHPQSAMPTV